MSPGVTQPWGRHGWWAGMVLRPPSPHQEARRAVPASWAVASLPFTCRGHACQPGQTLPASPSCPPRLGMSPPLGPLASHLSMAWEAQGHSVLPAHRHRTVRPGGSEEGARARPSPRAAWFQENVCSATHWPVPTQQFRLVEEEDDDEAPEQRDTASHDDQSPPSRAGVQTAKVQLWEVHEARGRPGGACPQAPGTTQRGSRPANLRCGWAE